jgi:hypothetical protein
LPNTASRGYARRSFQEMCHDAQITLG